MQRSDDLSTHTLLRFLAPSVLLGSLLLAPGARAEEAPADTVFLANGGRVRGTISVEDPVAGVTIVLADKSVKQIPAKDVKRIVYAGGLAGTASPPPPPPAFAPAQPSYSPVAPPPAAPLAAPLAQRCVRDADCGPGRYCDAADVCQGPGPLASRPRERGGRRLTGLWVSGLVIWATSYAATVIGTGLVTAGSGTDPKWGGFGGSLVPVVGPWIVMGIAAAEKSDHWELAPLGWGLLVASGVLQGVGFTTFVIGASVRSGGDSAALPRPRFALLPEVGPRKVGLSLTITDF